MRRWLDARRLWRIAFWCYVPILFTATHTPGVNLEAKIRIDLVVHLGAFGTWAGLLTLAAYFGPWFSWRNVQAVWPIAVVYAAIDESLQAIPWVHRHAAVDDWCANVLGISLACATLMILGRSRRRSPGPPP